MPKVIISGGGTGGHIFPAIAIANAIKEIEPTTEFLFVGAKGRMEMEKVPEAGYPIEGLWISGFSRSLSIKNLLFPFKLISSMLRSRALVNQFKPDLAIGTGGFASGPVLRAASAKGIPSVIQEQNSYAGVTNKILAQSVAKVCVAYRGMEKFFPEEKIVVSGNPVRKEVVNISGKREKALVHFGLTKEKPVALVVGGSLGARSVNLAIKMGLEKLVEYGVQLIWQTGKTTYDEMSSAAKPFEKKGIKAHQFIKEMDLAYAAADVVISRAGAIAVSELCLVAKPSILVPFPFAAEDHQTKNAQALVQHNAAILVKDDEASEKVIDELLNLIKDEKRRLALSENSKRLGIENSAEIIAREALKLIGK